ncbi:hypothetical protein IAR50_006424 [Cryptococcus sp. DSM 104548]
MDPIHQLHIPRSHSQDDQEHQGGHETDMQRELANQVAAQAIEAAVAAQSEAGARADAGAGMAPELGGGREDEARDIDMRDTSHPPQHHPRQPTFPRSRHSFTMQESSAAGPSTVGRSPVAIDAASTSTAHGPPVVLSANDQIAVLRESYARNPNPSKQELERLAARTGRPWNKIREYFRQRRNKLRGLETLETMIEPGRAQGWLLITYRSASPTSYVPQLSLYNAYKHRFDPYSITTPLLGGQDLIQLACATFPGCEMARDEGEYVLKGLAKKAKENGHQDEHGASHVSDGIDKSGHKYAEGVDPEDWEKGMEGLVEPLRAGSWLLSSFQSNPSGTGSPITQTDLYTSYAARFSSLLSASPHLQPEEERGKDESKSNNQAESLMAFQEAGLGDTRGEEGETGPVEGDDIPTIDEEQHDAPPIDATAFPASVPSPEPAPPTSNPPKEDRLLTPLELINLTRMTFPTCEPLVDEYGRFIVKGLERREGHEPGKKRREGEMYPFALMREVEGETRVGEEFVRAIKRKLANLQDGPDLAIDAKIEEGKAKRRREEPLTEEDREMLEGLKRFKSSRLGQEVHDACISQ